MPFAYTSFFRRWIITTIGVLVAAGVISGIRADSVISLLCASLILGVLNAVLRPFLTIISLPLVVLTFGVFYLVINAVLLYFVGDLVAGFFVADFWAAFKGGIVISIVSLFANVFAGSKKVVVQRRAEPPRPPTKTDTGSGPIIDV